MVKETFAEGNTVELDELQVRMVEIESLLNKKAPKLQPSIYPRQFKQTVADVQALLATTAGKTAAATAAADGDGGDVNAKAPGSSVGEESKQVGEVEDNQEGDKDRYHVVLNTETDIATRTFRITGAQLAGKIDATLSDLELLMELHLNASQDELEPYVSRFASANDLVFSNGQTAASALQDVCCLAYALRVAASNIAGWTGFVGPFQLPLSDDVDVIAMMREIFKTATPPPSLGPPKSGKKGGRSKSKGRGAGGGSKKSKPVAGATVGAAGTQNEGRETRSKERGRTRERGDAKPKERGDTKSNGKEDTKSKERGDIKSNGREDTKSKERGNTKSKERGDTKSKERGDTKSKERGNTRSKETGGKGTSPRGLKRKK